MKLNIRIRRARKDAGFSQKRLAELTGVQRSAVAQWERDGGTSPSSDRLARIAVATGVNHEWLSTGRGSRLAAAEDESQANEGLQLAYYAQCELEERVLLAFRELRSREQIAHVEFLENLAGRGQSKSGKNRQSDD